MTQKEMNRVIRRANKLAKIIENARHESEENKKPERSVYLDLARAIVSLAKDNAETTTNRTQGAN